MKHFLASLSVIAVAVLLISSCTSSPKQGQMGSRFKAHLTAAKGVASSANGDASFQLSADGMKLSYTLTVSGITDVTMAHIHVSAVAGENGDVTAWLYPRMAPMKMKAGMFSGVLGEGTIAAASLEGPLAGKTLADLVDAIKQGRAYVNVHTQQNPDGEIQGVIQ